jgi:hypothetical protein
MLAAMHLIENFSIPSAEKMKIHPWFFKRSLAI